MKHYVIAKEFPYQYFSDVVIITDNSRFSIFGFIQPEHMMIRYIKVIDNLMHIDEYIDEYITTLVCVCIYFIK